MEKNVGNKKTVVLRQGTLTEYVGFGTEAIARV
jgi:hypothetical protein